jgi:FkbM family methyltransferase
MVTTNDLQALERAGRLQEARSAAQKALGSSVDAERLAGGLFLIANTKFDLFGEALAALKPMKDQIAGDFEACNLLAFAGIVVVDTELCRWACYRCIALNPAASGGYLRLGMLELSLQRNAEAFLALSAGLLHCPKEIASLQVWYKLAKALTQGVRNVKFTWDGVEFTFQLSTFSGHAMEATCNHILGRFSEAEELRYVQKFVGHCDSIVEVGLAVGNHTLFFAKFLSPKIMHVFDANALAAKQVRENVALNFPPPSGPQINIYHAAVCDKPGTLRISDQDVAAVRLDDEVKQHVDFMKIDVDGMEMDVLEGCRGLIARDRPKVMIEIQHELKERFVQYLREQNYEIEHEISRAADTNYFIRPKQRM